MKSEQQFQPTLLADVNIQPPIESGIADAVSMMQFGKVLYKMYLYRAKGILVRYSDKNTHKSVFLSKPEAIAFGKVLSFTTAEKWIRSRPAVIFGEKTKKEVSAKDTDRKPEQSAVSAVSRQSDSSVQPIQPPREKPIHKPPVSFSGVIQNMGMTERTDRKGRKYQSFVMVLQDKNGIQNEFLGVGLARLASDMKLQIGQKIRLSKETKSIEVTFDGKNTRRLRNEYSIEFVN